MTSQDVTRIRVGKHPTGIVGLHEALEQVASGHKGQTDDEIRKKLLACLSKKNYINPKIQGLYGDAFLREYKKFMGEPFEEDAPEWVRVRVLGPGCPNCDRMEQELMQVIAELGIAADIEHVRDILEIASYGKVAVPALVINDKVMASGQVPAKEQMKEWLMAAARGN
jgi:small redox-active disulfide protein 2